MTVLNCVYEKTGKRKCQSEPAVEKDLTNDVQRALCCNCVADKPLVHCAIYSRSTVGAHRFIWHHLPAKNPFKRKKKPKTHATVLSPTVQTERRGTDIGGPLGTCQWHAPHEKVMLEF